MKCLIRLVDPLHIVKGTLRLHRDRARRKQLALSKGQALHLVAEQKANWKAGVGIKFSATTMQLETT